MKKKWDRTLGEGGDANKTPEVAAMWSDAGDKRNRKFRNRLRSARRVYRVFHLLSAFSDPRVSNGSLSTVYRVLPSFTEFYRVELIDFKNETMKWMRVSKQALRNPVSGLPSFPSRVDWNVLDRRLPDYRVGSDFWSRVEAEGLEWEHRDDVGSCWATPGFSGTAEEENSALRVKKSKVFSAREFRHTSPFPIGGKQRERERKKQINKKKRVEKKKICLL